MTVSQVLVWVITAIAIGMAVYALAEAIAENFSARRKVAPKVYKTPYPRVCPDCFHDECDALVQAYWLLETARQEDLEKGMEWRPLI